MCETADTSPLLSPQPNTQPIYHAFSNYITHLNEEGPRDLLAHMGALSGQGNYQSVCDTTCNSTVNHSLYKPV